MIIKERYDAVVPRFLGNMDNNFHFRSILVKEAFRGEEIISNLTNKSVASNVNERALANIIMVLGDSPL